MSRHTIWVDQKTNCITQINDQSKHGCEVNLRKENFKKKLKKKIENDSKILEGPTPSENFRILKSQTTTDYFEESEIGFVQDFKEQMKHARRKVQKKVTSVLEDLDKTNKIYFRKGESILKHNEKDFAIFTTDENLRLFTDKDNTTYIADGTFRMVPQEIKNQYKSKVHSNKPQVLIIHQIVKKEYNGKEKTVAVPLVYILQVNAQLETYLKSLNKLKTLIKKASGREPLIKVVHVDFETNLKKSFKNVFNSIIKFCFFHFSDCIMRMVKDLSLFSHYKSQEGIIYKLIKMILIIPLFDHIDFNFVFKHILFKYQEKKNDEIPDELNNHVATILNYTQKNWVGFYKYGKQVKAPLNGDSKEISVYHNLNLKTTNYAESFHRFVHPQKKYRFSFVEFIQCLQTKLDDTEDKYLSFVTGKHKFRKNQRYDFYKHWVEQYKKGLLGKKKLIEVLAHEFSIKTNEVDFFEDEET